MSDPGLGDVRPGPAERTARLGAIGLVIATGVHGVTSGRTLFADGTLYFWTELTTSGIFWYVSRIVAQFLMQLPVLAGLGLGVTDIGVLLRLQGIGMIGIPVAIWLFALVLLRRDPLFWPMVVAFAVVYFTSGFMAVGEFNLSYAAVAASAAILLRRAPLGGASSAALLGLAAVLPFSYETMALLAPALGATLLLRARRDARDGFRWPRWLLVSILTLYAGATVVSCWFIAVPRDPSNLGGAFDLLGVLARSGQLRLAVVAGLLVVVALTLGGPRIRVAGSVLAVGAGVLLLLGDWSTAGMHYQARTVVGLALGAMLVPMALARLRPVRPDRARFGATWIGPALFCVASAVPLTVLTAGYPGWLGHYDAVVSRPGGETPIAASDLRPDLVDRYGWAWTHPFLSRVLTHDGELIILPPGQDRGGWVPAPIPARYDTSTPIYPAP